jgi:hypothetical protein
MWIVKYRWEVVLKLNLSLVSSTQNPKFTETPANWEYTVWLPKRNKTSYNTICCLQFKYLLTSLGVFEKLRKATLFFACLFVYPSECNISTPTARIFMKFCNYLNIFWKSVEEVQGLLKSTLREDHCRFLILSLWILRRMGNISEFVDKIKTCIFGKSYHLWDNVEEYARPLRCTAFSSARHLQRHERHERPLLVKDGMGEKWPAIPTSM